jgi:hypothetical protein
MAHHRMPAQNNGIKPLPSLHAPSSIDPVSPPIIGPQPFFMWHTSTTAVSTPVCDSLHLRFGLGNALIYNTYRSLDPEFTSRRVVTVTKLDYHHFDGIFIGCTATDHNMEFIDINSDLVKRSHHAVFNKAWYLQPLWPPVAQLLYNLGVKEDDDSFMTTSQLWYYFPLLPLSHRYPRT